MRDHTIIIGLFALLFISLIAVYLQIDKGDKGPHYIIVMYDTEVKIIDPETDKIIYTEKYESKSNFVNALLDDNE